MTYGVTLLAVGTCFCKKYYNQFSAPDLSVPSQLAASSPISQSGLLFYNTLFDENAASHLALGRAYRFCAGGGGTMSDDDAQAVGLNDSLTHVDFMIGSGEMEIAGVREDRSEEPGMRAGERAF